MSPEQRPELESLTTAIETLLSQLREQTESNERSLDQICEAHGHIEEALTILGSVFHGNQTAELFELIGTVSAIERAVANFATHTEIPLTKEFLRLISFRVATKTFDECGSMSNRIIGNNVCLWIKSLFDSTKSYDFTHSPTHTAARRTLFEQRNMDAVSSLDMIAFLDELNPREHGMPPSLKLDNQNEDHLLFFEALIANIKEEIGRAVLKANSSHSK